METQDMIPAPPEGITGDAEELWYSLCDDYGVRDAARYALVRVAVEAAMRYDEAREHLAADGVVARDRFGQLQQHPAVAIERSARTALLRALAQLAA